MIRTSSKTYTMYLAIKLLVNVEHSFVVQNDIIKFKMHFRQVHILFCYHLKVTL